ncbi:alpha/beta-Hydrolases superfamily protein [Perilla frutescens var. hirtella]|uniref:Alpha/beta-Hydrolases superfamily protein n=1 Tax=Perilla frutescens var. hirtella TaxID=608512 RepID=A0AAD4JMV3_PERFH|nr:alpha/beta-Hydrolases superfamily protein [Perilla frutescens var. hirtella]
MIGHIACGLMVGFVWYGYATLRPPPPKICGSPGGPPVSSRRLKLDDGRHLAYKERGVPKEEAKHKIIIAHAFADSKDFHLPISEEVLKELQIYILAFDRAGYGESDPNPIRSVKSEAFDVQQLADKLLLGPKFSLISISLGAHVAYACLKYIPHRLAGVALVVPLVNYWWRCFPATLSCSVWRRLPARDRWTFRVAHYAPWLLYWWMTRRWIPSMSSLGGRAEEVFSPSDLEIMEKLAKAPVQDEGKAVQQGVHESLHRDLIVGFGDWGFDPTDICDPFPNNEGCVHLWQGYEDKIFPFELSRHIHERLPWIRYHEVVDAGHLLIYNAAHCDAIFKALVQS